VRVCARACCVRERGKERKRAINFTPKRREGVAPLREREREREREKSKVSPSCTDRDCDECINGRLGTRSGR